ncbi:YaiO family outer membrane beta-barrel protein [Ralstonia pickettii]|uniref:YaiO family outer membrane beta-barrel protein n=1 Tax=Ralstonia pickettii TaxID=329 RepID=UPI002715552C|nr:YaiO family outer membrane beta-barrel protein [Ralstonia pickettii]WKZ88225.1 YaiO family outer membrane beta-barrel protein [Ralstonia pickettii]
MDRTSIAWMLAAAICGMTAPAAWAQAAEPAATQDTAAQSAEAVQPAEPAQGTQPTEASEALQPAEPATAPAAATEPEQPAAQEGAPPPADATALAATPVPTPGANAPTVPQPLPEPYVPERAAIEAVLDTGHMSDGFGGATAVALRGMMVTSYGIWQAELDRQSRFGFAGQYGALSLTRDLSEDYYVLVGAGTGNSELFSKWRVDVAGYRKFGPDRRFVAGIGAYYAQGQDSVRNDQGLVLSSLAYFPSVVLEGGLRFNRANPGMVFGPSQYIAATIGNDEKRALVLRVEHAREAYQVLTTGTERADYNSMSYAIQWRERVARDLLLIVGAQYYHNPFYNRTYGEIGFRWSFR